MTTLERRDRDGTILERKDPRADEWHATLITMNDKLQSGQSVYEPATKRTLTYQA